jgi:hypothetical protein
VDNEVAIAWQNAVVPSNEWLLLEAVFMTLLHWLDRLHVGHSVQFLDVSLVPYITFDFSDPVAGRQALDRNRDNIFVAITVGVAGYGRIYRI